jgi:hypothetical protein
LTDEFHPGIAWAEIELGAVCHLDVDTARDDVLEVRGLTEVGTGDGLDVL